MRRVPRLNQPIMWPVGVTKGNVTGPGHRLPGVERNALSDFLPSVFFFLNKHFSKFIYDFISFFVYRVRVIRLKRKPSKVSKYAKNSKIYQLGF